MTNIIRDLRQKERFLLTLIFISIFSLLVFDVVEDLESGVSLTHIGFEALILILAIAGVLIQTTVFFTQRRSLKAITLDLGKARQDLENYKRDSRKYTEGLSRKIDDQLSSWDLTTAEKEIALLILKGLSNKEIGEIRGTSEKTVRQQVYSIFQKSNLSTRLELSAFFLEDLLVIS